MSTLTVKQQWSDWTDPAPIAKLSTSLLAFVIAIVLEVTSGDIHHVEWFAGAIGTLVTATALALFLSPRKERWRFQYWVPGLLVLVVAQLRLATDSSYSPLLFLAVLPSIWIADGPGRRFVLYSSLAAAFSLLLPALLDLHVAQNTDTLTVGIFATIVLSMVAYIWNSALNSVRNLAQQRAALLEESREHALELERSEGRRGSAERMLRGVWEAVTEQGVIVTDLDGRIEGWNPGAEKMLGYTTAEMSTGRHVTELHEPDELQERAGDETAAFSALVAVAKGGAADVREWTYVRADSTTIPVEVSVTARRDEHGGLVGYLFVVNDVTKAKEVAKLKDDFVGLISHELRTPLSSILGYLELMRDADEAGLSENQLQYLGVAERNAHRLLRLVGDLLFTAQVESGSFHLDQKALELGPIIAASIETAGPTAARSGVTLVADVMPGVIVEGDAVRLGQAVDNLVSNATKFTPRGGSVTITLTTTAESAVLTVRDTGIGIAASELHKLFSRFFRATTATRNAVPGVGLGLTITKAIVIAHAGQMGVESEEGVGTAFSITLPLARVGAVAAEAVSRS